jgi:hypothetical protein
MADIKRNINYLNRDFASFRNALINYSRTYFPETYTDFSQASPGMMFMEMASYVGDVMSFYLDSQVQETFIQYAQQNQNLYDLAYMLGYKPKDTYVATVDMDLYQTVPATGSGANVAPDFNYALQIEANSVASTSLVSTTNFLIEDRVNFQYSSSSDPTEITVYQASGGVPTSYLLKKTRKAYSATITTKNLSAGNFTPYPTFIITDSNIIGILDIEDSAGNPWYEVDYLAQETILDTIKNTNPNDPNTSSDNEVPYLLKLKKVQNRFATRLINTGSLQIQFGAGNVNDTTEEVIPNPDNIGMGLPYGKDSLTIAYSPNNFMYTNTYGVAPVNTTLRVRYLTGGGVNANVQANSINNLSGNVTFVNSNVNNGSGLANDTFASLYVNNPKAASGGRGGDTPFDLRNQGLGSYQMQLRTVTQEDYLVRSLSMPSKFGVVSKAFIEPTKASNLDNNNLSTLDLYVLSYDSNKYLTTASSTLKKNLSTYLSVYRSVNDSINIKDAFIINIAVSFDIIVLPNFDNNQVINNCIVALKNYFAVDKWQINQPIVLSELYIMLDKIRGVQTVKSIDVTNKSGESLGYSNNSYDISGATINNVVYPSLDPSIFEVKYPNSDIQGRVVPL